MNANDGTTNEATHESERIKDVSFQTDKKRRLILLSYWIVILFAIPLWWTTTSITRLALPEDRVRALQGREVSFIFHDTDRI